SDARAYVREVERLGFRTLWIQEGLGSKEIFAHAALLLSATEHLVIATGIANMWARDAVAMANGGRTLVDAYPDRFLLGIGVSHAPIVRLRGRTYERPGERMLENYANNLRRLGWSDVDLANDGSDSLVDAIVAWGDREAIRARVDAHLANGADHVCLQPLRIDLAAPATKELADLARLL